MKVSQEEFDHAMKLHKNHRCPSCGYIVVCWHCKKCSKCMKNADDYINNLNVKLDFPTVNKRKIKK